MFDYMIQLRLNLGKLKRRFSLVVLHSELESWSELVSGYLLMFVLVSEFVFVLEFVLLFDLVSELWFGSVSESEFVW